MEKYRYRGQDNKRCPVCGSKITVGPPVIYFLNGEVFAQHRWCQACFYVVHKMMSVKASEKHIELHLLPALTHHARAALGEKMPDDHHVKGFQFATVPQQGLTLVMEVQYEW